MKERNTHVSERMKHTRLVREFDAAQRLVENGRGNPMVVTVMIIKHHTPTSPTEQMQTSVEFLDPSKESEMRQYLLPSVNGKEGSRAHSYDRSYSFVGSFTHALGRGLDKADRRLRRLAKLEDEAEQGTPEPDEVLEEIRNLIDKKWDAEDADE